MRYLVTVGSDPRNRRTLIISCGMAAGFLILLASVSVGSALVPPGRAVECGERRARELSYSNSHPVSQSSAHPTHDPTVRSVTVWDIEQGGLRGLSTPC